ncbi:signal peptidase I [Candidatus Erwinia haradaeae]|uniref:Signal peptidase I n=1 Tax=Candidatus Erwinia haradaeae TaxID=1922217 RepID=A0A451D7G1_9GAMM|nr:signal peptidase I [Candidatus Erwinia haradaeae]VFP81747.1 Signal peptidase I [Candidatus Erwinia haradaeae]
MAHIFAVFLAISTLGSGIIWCINRIKAVQYRYRKNTEGQRKAMEITTEKGRGGLKEAIASIFPVLLLVFIMRSFIFEPFYIPSGSMIPTLLIGDFILVEKYAYGLRDPITNTVLIKTSHPKRGDIVVFQYPKNPRQDYIKRIIGLPGDRVDYNPIQKTLSIISSCVNKKDCDGLIKVTYSNDRENDRIVSKFSTNVLDHTFDQLLSNDLYLEGLHITIRNETIDNMSHRILLSHWEKSDLRSIPQKREEIPLSWFVPEKMYFVMGDNRDNSSDSRIWGFVSEDHLIGKAIVIWMSIDKQIGQWPTGLAFRRIGMIQ